MIGFFKQKKRKKQKKPRAKEPIETANRRRAPKNKTASSAEPKDAAQQTPKSGRARKAAKRLAHFLLAAALTAGILLLGIAAYRHAVTSEYFKLKTCQITGNKRLSEKDILKAAGLTLGQNIFATDTVSAQKRLLENPWIQESQVARRLPEKVIIRVTERKARALVNLDVLYLVDDTGKVFKRWVRGDPIPSPVITGISREEYIQSQEAVEARLCDAIDLADRYAATGLERTQPLQEIFREPNNGFSLTVGEDPVYVKFGKGPYKAKLARLAALLNRLTSENKRPEQIFFDNEIRPDRITVKLKGDLLTDKNGHEENLPKEAKKIVSKI